MALPTQIGDANTLLPADVGRIGPYLIGSAWYAIAFEQATNSVHLRAFRSTDPTSSWTAQDTAHEWASAGSGKSADAPFSIDCQVVGTVIHVIAAANNNTTNGCIVIYAKFDSSGNTWTITSETVATTTSTAYVGLAVRSNGDVVGGIVPDSSTTLATGAGYPVYKKRTGGAWGSAVAVGSATSGATSLAVLLGASDRVHFLYPTGGTNVKHRSLSSGDSLDTEAVAYAANTAVSKGTAYVDGGSTRIRVAVSDGHMIKADSGANPSLTSEVFSSTGSNITAPLAVTNDGTTLYVLWASKANQFVYRNSSVSNGGSWTADTATVSSAQYRVAGNIYIRAGNYVLGYVYAGTAAGSVFHNEVTLRSSATAYTQPTTGTLTFSGARANRTSKPFAAAQAVAGTLARVVGYPLVAALSFTGSIVRLISYPLTATLTLSGVILFFLTRILAASLALSGEVLYLLARALAASLALSGSMLYLLSRALSAALTSVGDIVKTGMPSISGTLSFNGTVSRAMARPVSAILSFAGTVLSLLTRGLSGALTSVGAVVKTALPGGISGTLSFNGDISRAIVASLDAILSFVGTALFFLTRDLAAIASFTGTTLFVLARAASGVLTSVGDMTKTAIPGVAGTLSFAGDITRGIGQQLAAAVSFAVETIRDIARASSSVLGLSGSTANFTDHPGLTAVLDFVGATANMAIRAVDGVVDFVGSIASNPVFDQFVDAALAFAGATSQLVLAARDSVLSFASDLPRAISHVLDTVMTLRGFIARDSSMLLDTATLGFLGNTAQLTIRLFTAMLFASGVIARFILAPLAALLGLAGETLRDVSHSLTAALVFSSTFTEAASVIISAVLGFVGDTARAVSHNLDFGSLTFLGGFSRPFLLSAILGFVGSTTKQIGYTVFTAVLGFGTRFSKMALLPFSALLSFLTASPLLVNRRLAALLGLFGQTGKQLPRFLSSSLTFAGVVGRQAQKFFTGALSTTGVFGRMLFWVLLASLDFIGRITRSYLLTAVLMLQGAIGRGVPRALSASLTFAGRSAKATFRSLTAAVSAVGAVTLHRSKVLFAVLTFTGSLGNAVIDLVLSIARYVRRVFARDGHYAANVIDITEQEEVHITEKPSDPSG